MRRIVGQYSPLLSLLLWLLSTSEAQAARLIAVLPLDVRMTKGKVDDAAQASLEEMLRDSATNALTGAGWTVLTGETMLQVLLDNGVKPEACGNQTCHLQMAREIKAEKFLSGNVQYVEGQFIASIRLIDSASGRILASERLEGGSVTALRKDFAARAEAFFVKGGMIEAGTNSPVVVKAGDGRPLAAVPSPPKTLDAAGGLGLDVDANVLVAYDAALKADRNGQSAPAAARDGWARVAAITKDNPYLKTALERQKQWSDYADQLQRAASQKQADFDKVQKLLPLESLSAAQRGQLLANYLTAHGTKELPTLLPLVGEGGLMPLCAAAPALAAVEADIRVEARDADGAETRATVSFDGHDLGAAPAQVHAALCTGTPVVAAEVGSTSRWSEPLWKDGAKASLVRTAVFPVMASTAVAGTTWRFGGMTSTVTFNADGTTNDANSTWSQNGADLTWTVNGFTQFTVKVKGKHMTGSWVRLQGEAASGATSLDLVR